MLSNARQVRWVLVLACVLAAVPALAQPVGTAFTYQGRLTDGGTPANGLYDLQFKVYDAPTNGNQLPIGSPVTLTKSGQLVTNGLFTVQLDFGASAFPGGDRFLDTAVKHPADSSFTPLSPRQQLTAAPYALRALAATSAEALGGACTLCVTDAQIQAVGGSKVTGAVANANLATDSTQLGGIAASQYVVTTDPRMTDARPPISGSDNYIQNRTTPQPGNFNIGGNATVGGTLNVNTVDAATQYNLGGGRILSTPLGNNLFVGAGAGLSNTSGNFNAFVGLNVGRSNTIGNTNTFFGAQVGADNVDGSQNAFFGVNAGRSNVSGVGNAFFGSGQSPFGTGFANADGNFNSFFGYRAGRLNNGNSNSFFGVSAGDTNTTGSSNVVMGDNADVGAGDLTNATAIGSNALVTTSNALVLGSINGTNGATADTNVGIGTTAPTERLHVIGNGYFTGSLFASSIGTNALNAGSGTFIGIQASSLTIPQNSQFGVTTPRLSVGGPASVGLLSIVPASGGSLSLCLTNLQSQIATCSSSIRYKQNVRSFGSGLSLVDRLRPVSFNWKADNQPDMGLVAEEVAEVEPLLVTHNDKGEVEGVKYDRLGVVLINAVKEQQVQIERQQRQIDTLTRTLCSLEPETDICRQKEE